MICNRSFTPASVEMIQAAPFGEHPHPSGFIQVIDGPAARTMVAQFHAEKTQPNFPGLLVDYDHFSDDPSKPSEAAGWIKDLEVRDNGVWAQVALTRSAVDKLEDGAYRNVSPTFDGSRMERLDNNRVRPLRLMKLALCNDPNIKGMIPLSNRGRSNPGGGQLPDYTPEDALAHFVNRVNQIAGGKPTFINAWQRVRDEDPMLYCFAFGKTFEHVIANRSSAPIRRGAHAYLSPDVPALVNRLQRPGITFERTWQELQFVEPELFGLPNNLANRFQVPFGTFDKVFEKHEGEARRAVREYFNHEMVETIPIIRPLRAFLNLLNAIRSEQPAWDFARVWEELKARNPDLVKSFVVSLT